MCMQVRLDLSEGRLSRPESREDREKLAALLVQAEAGDWTGDTRHPAYYHWANVVVIGGGATTSLPGGSGETTLLEEAALDVADAHAEIQGMKTATAEYWILKEVSTLENFGEEVFQCKDVRLGIGPHGINIYQPNPQKIPYTAIRSASSLRRLFQLWYLGPDHTELLLEIKCDSCLSASGLYRALTEKHAFYNCDTVRGAVTAQYIRDLKGTIVSIFNESSPLGKKYVFDIRRTCREVHDNARRALYEPARTDSEGAGASDATGATAGNCGGATGSTAAGEKLARLMDALSCRICMDAGIDTVLFPCAHVICCHACAERCTSCPLCRSEIESAKRVYLPTLELGIGGGSGEGGVVSPTVTA